MLIRYTTTVRVISLKKQGGEPCLTKASKAAVARIVRTLPRSFQTPTVPGGRILLFQARSRFQPGLFALTTALPVIES